MIRTAALALALALALAGAAPAGADEADRLLGFADSLTALGEHYRAVTEYLRFVDAYSNHPEAPRAFLAVGKAHLAGGRWAEARSWLARFRDAYPAHPLTGESWLLTAEAWIGEGRPGDALRELASVRPTLAPPFADRALWASARAAVEAGAWEEAAQLSAEAEGHPRLRARAAELSAALAARGDVPRRSPVAAGVLSAVLPGAGQLYVGRAADAFWAFALNAAFLWAAIDSFDNGNEAAGIVLSFFELGWYTGNVYNAVNQADRFNRSAMERFRDGLSGSAGWQVGLAPSRSGGVTLAATWRW